MQTILTYILVIFIILFGLGSIWLQWEKTKENNKFRKGNNNDR